MDNFSQLIKRLSEHGVRFVVIGGYAAMLHGSDVVTQDVDVCASMDRDNLARIIAALHDIDPVFRFHIKRLPLYNDADALFGVKNLYLRTDLGILDILGEVTGLGGYPEAEKSSIPIDFFGMQVRLLDLDVLIATKLAAGRSKDLAAVKHLETIRRQSRETPES